MLHVGDAVAVIEYEVETFTDERGLIWILPGKRTRDIPGTIEAVHTDGTYAVRTMYGVLERLDPLALRAAGEATIDIDV